MTNWLLGLIGGGALVTTLGSYPSLFAQSPFIPGLNEQPPIAVRKLIQGPFPPSSTSSTQPSQSGITLPSLWWIDRQFGEKLVIDWFAYDDIEPQNQQVQIFVRSNLWTRFSYLERYAFITHFGSMTRTYGYQMLILDTRGYPLASYTCNFDHQQPTLVPGTQDHQSQPIETFEGNFNQTEPCQLWMNGAFPRAVL
jgi:hypothetical protein